MAQSLAASPGASQKAIELSLFVAEFLQRLLWDVPFEAMHWGERWKCPVASSRQPLLSCKHCSPALQGNVEQIFAISAFPNLPPVLLVFIMYGSWWSLLGGDCCLVLYSFIPCLEALAIATAWTNNIVEPVNLVAAPV